MMLYKSLFLILIISSCSLFENQDFIITETIETRDDAIDLVASKIKYVSNSSDIFQYPKETYNSKKGDCEDQASLLAYIFENILFIENVYIVFCYNKTNNNYHVLTEASGVYYESITGEDISDKRDDYIIITKLTLSQYMSLAILDHL